MLGMVVEEMWFLLAEDSVDLHSEQQDIGRIKNKKVDQ